MSAEKNDMSIAYQNKDIVSKLFGDRMKGKPLSLFGLNTDAKVASIQPTNIPVVDVKELRMDNIFELDDGSVAILDYESVYREDNFFKYGLYVMNVLKRYLKENKSPDIHMMVLYTADIENAQTTLHKTACDIHIEAAYLTGVDSEAWKREIQEGINTRSITDEMLMHLILLPLTYKGTEEKQTVIEECARLARKIADEEMETFALSGLLAFTDKVISEKTRNNIKEVLSMTKVGKMLMDEGRMEGRKEGRKEGRLEKTREASLKMLKKGFDYETVAEVQEVSIEQLKAWEEEACCIS